MQASVQHGSRHLLVCAANMQVRVITSKLLGAYKHNAAAYGKNDRRRPVAYTTHTLTTHAQTHTQGPLHTVLLVNNNATQSTRSALDAYRQRRIMNASRY